jgi:diguanylate cyclase (GGDEF)-like protein
MMVALVTVSYTTQFMPPQAQALTWAAAVILPIVMTAPICFYFASTLRRLAIAHDELALVAAQDSLTTCLNRGAFLTLVDGYLRTVRDEPQGAMLVVDADHFKSVNDRFGHAAGDDALRLISRSLQSVLRPVDLLGRIGGEEFAVFLPTVDMAVAMQVAERARSAVAALAFAPNGEPFRLSVSVGAVVFTGQVAIDTLLARADALLYEAKEQGRDRVAFGAGVLAA